MFRTLTLLFTVTAFTALFLQCRSGSGTHYSGGWSEGTFREGIKIIRVKPETRFAVLDFTDSSGSFTAYGKVIGDETFYRLSVLKGIHLLERQKLSLLLEEHKLEQAGLISGTGAERLGRVLPVDIIVVGSYIFEGEKIRVNGRFTEIGSGEIKGTFQYYLNSPFGKGKGLVLPDEESTESCESYKKMIEPVMRDLRTPAMVEKAVHTAVQIPYTLKCMQIHQDIMNTFKRGGLYPEQYKQFLHNSIISIQDPGELKRKTAVFYYFQSDKIIDEMEWNTGILSMRNANERVIRRIVFFILNRGYPQDEKILLKRIDALIALAGDGAFGRPRTLSREKMFYFIFRAGIADVTTREIRLYLLDRYSDLIIDKKRGLSNILTYSEKILVQEKDQAARFRFYSHISRLFSSTDPEGKNSLVLQLCGFLREMHYRYGKSDKKELRSLTVSVAPWLCYGTTQIRRDYRLRSTIGILKAYNIKCTH